MQKLLVILFSLLSLNGFAQKEDIIYYEGELVRQWFYAAKAKIQEKMPSQSQLANATPQAIPPNMLDILKQNDWVDAGDYWFKNGKYDNNGENSHYLKLYRFTKTSQMYFLDAQISLNRSSSDKLIDYYHRQDPVISIEQINGRNFMRHSKKADEADSYSQIIYYQNGVFVYDVTREGTVNGINSIYRFRNVLIAMPKYDFGATHPSEMLSNATGAELSFPALNYPIVSSSPKRSNCNNPLSEVEFHSLAQEIFRLQSAPSRLSKLNQIAQAYCMNTAQAMRFATLLEADNDQLIFLKNTYDKCYDLDNFSSAVQVFRHLDTKDKLMEYIAKRQASQTNNTPRANPQTRDCQTIPDSEFQNILQSIAQEQFDQDRLKTAKALLQRYQCFKTQQVKQIAELFPFSSTRMQLIEAAYPYTYDPQNFYQIADILNFQSEKSKLQQIMRK